MVTYSTGGLVRATYPTPRTVDPNLLQENIRRLRGDTTAPPDATVVIPVNAQGDLENVLQILSDIADYSGGHSIEIVLVVNNYAPGPPPAAADHYARLGVKILTIPNVRRPGEAVGFSARLPGLRVASSETVVLFDADCRIRNSTALINWYIDRFRAGAKVAYTHVDFYDFPDVLSIRIKIVIHHATRWIKRVLLRIPTTRGSNYAASRTLMLELYDRGLLADEMHVGPRIKARGAKVAYSGARELSVFTSGRMYKPGWLSIWKYIRRRLIYNLRVLPTRANAAQYTGREADPVRRYVNNRPVRGGRGKGR
jgi:hypothetical protein